MVDCSVREKVVSVSVDGEHNILDEPFSKQTDGHTYRQTEILYV